MRSFFRRLRKLGGGFTRRAGFTLVELLTVMAIIAILAGLILSISGYANKKGALARASAEIQALSAGCESYKADNGTYPYQPLAVSGSIPPISGSFPSTNVQSDLLFPAGPSVNAGNSTVTAPGTVYGSASWELYQALTGDLTGSGTGSATGYKNYIADMKPDVWGRPTMTAAVSSSNQVFFLSDPFGNSYGYSTAEATATTSGTASKVYGFNPTFDLWSTGGAPTSNPSGVAMGSGSTGDIELQWVKNW